MFENILRIRFTDSVLVQGSTTRIKGKAHGCGLIIKFKDKVYR
jgi:hypothetical protein